MEELKLYEAHPKMFKNNPIFFLLCIALILAYGFGLAVLLLWWLNAIGTTLSVTTERVTLRNGILSKKTNEVYHTDIRNVQVSQGVFQRMFGVGKIGISTAGTGGIEIVVNGIPEPEKIKSIINQYRKIK